MKPDGPTPSKGLPFAALDDVVDIEAAGFECGVFYWWLRLRDGRGALFEYHLGLAPGQQELRPRVIAGA